VTEQHKDVTRLLQLILKLLCVCVCERERERDNERERGRERERGGEVKLYKPLGLQDVEDPRISEQLAHEGIKAVSPTHRAPVPPK